MTESGTLYIVATPIGNLGDISFRGKSILEKTEFIACEDTRRATKLLEHLALDSTNKQLRSFNTLNENDLYDKIIASLCDGMDVALISDAGTPTLSDPGLPLLRAAFDADVNVVPIPGPSALTTCLSVCPIPTNEFRFIGFLERRGESKRRQLNELLQTRIPVVLFESPKRILATLRAMVELGAGQRMLFLARELTKIHEEKLLDSVEHIFEEFDSRPAILGELVLVLAPAEADSRRQLSELLEIFAAERIPPSTSARLIAKLTGVSRREAFRELLAMQSSME